MIKGEFFSKTGNIRIEIRDGGDSTNVEISDISNLKYEFDLIPDSPEVDSVQSLYSKIDIEIFQHDLYQNELYDRISENIIASGGCAIYLYVNDDEFAFYVNINDIKLNEIERTISFSCRPLYDESKLVLDVFNDIEASQPNLIHKFLPFDDFPDETIDCVGVADWIKYAMRQVFLNNADSVVESCPSGLGVNYHQFNYNSFPDRIPQNVVTSIMARMEADVFSGYGEPQLQEDKVFHEGGGILTGGDFSNVNIGDRFTLFSWQAGEFIVNVTQVISSESVVIDDSTIKQVAYTCFIQERFSTDQETTIFALKELATIEGSIFGYAFGKNFFINRIQRNEVVEIPWDDITDIDIDPFYNPVGGGFTMQMARFYSQVGDSLVKNIGAENLGIWPVESGNWELPTITDAKVAAQEVEGVDQRVNLRLAPGYPFFNKAISQQRSQPDGGDRFLGRYWPTAIAIDPNDSQPTSYPSPPEVWYEDYKVMIALCRSGIRSYMRSLSSDGNNIAIDLTSYKATRVKPWNLIKIVDGATYACPVRYKDKLFRPTSIEYDFVRDLFSAECYQVLEDDVPLNKKEMSAITSVATEVSATINVFSTYFVSENAEVGVEVEATINTDTPIPPPENLSACKNTPQGYARVSWGIVNEADEYKLYRDNALVATTSSASYNDTVPEQNKDTQYFYQVRAVTGTSESALSDPVLFRWNTATECS